jgi:pimeloyl-ACP methyl ester carboxylesterase
VAGESAHFVHAADGFRLALTEVTGRAERAHGVAFLLIHGFAQNRRAYSAGAFPRLLAERGARVFLGELRGHGRSAATIGDPLSWSLSTHLDLDLPALIDHVRVLANVPVVHLVGHSMGGMLGAALLARETGRAIASLTLFASPLSLGKHSPLVRLAALVAAPALRRAPAVPMHQFLRSFSPLLIARGERTLLRSMLEVIALASSRTADAEVLTEILASSEQESALVLAELADMGVRGKAVIDGIDLLETTRASSLPIACVVGKNDILAPRASIGDFERDARGPRLVVEIADALHVDLLVGRHAAELVGRLWPFLTGL